MSPQQFPAIPARPRNLQHLLDLLGRRHLETDGIGFAAPTAVLRTLAHLRFRAFEEPSRPKGMVRLEVAPEVLEGFLTGGRTVAWFVRSDGEAVEVGVGGAEAMVDGMARQLGAILGARVKPLTGGAAALSKWPFWGCLQGSPREASQACSSDRPALTDVLLDAMDGQPFVQVVLAMPEEWHAVSAELDALRASAEWVERENLAVGDQRDVGRAARRARELLDLLLTERETRRLWRCAAILGASSPEHVSLGLGLIAGGLACDPEDSAQPLRPFPCSGTEVGYSVQQLLAPSSRLASLAMLPQRDRTGWAIQARVEFDVDHPLRPGGIPLGTIMDGARTSGRTFTIAPDVLCAHALVVGHTGSGKSTTVRHLLVELSRSGVPFLVIEPAKAEYRRLAAEVPTACVLQVGAVTKRGGVPFLMNPLAFPPGYPLHAHVDHLKQAFVASFGLVPPAPYLLEAAIHAAYRRAGWDDMTGEHPNGFESTSFPTLSDLLAEIDPTIEAAGYDRDVTANLRAALRVRIGSLCAGPRGLSFDTREELPARMLFGGSTILELRHVGTDEEKAFVMGLVLMRLHELRETEAPATGRPRLRHLLVIEEAHRLLRSVRERSAEEGNMAHQAVAAFTNVLAEVRAHGQGILVVDQLPSKLAPEVVKQSGLKLVHRLPPADDRATVGATMVLDDARQDALAVLPIGHAVVHCEGMDGGVQIVAKAPTASPSVGAADLRARARVRLNGEELARIDAIVERSRWSAPLTTRPVRAVADSFFTRLAGGAPAMDAAKRLLATLEAHLSESADPRAAARELAPHALGESLMRRALPHRWNRVRIEKLRAMVVTIDPRLGPAYLGALAAPRGPRPWCSPCRTRCRWRYEASLLNTDDRLAEDVARAITNGPPDGRRASTASAVRAAAERALDWDGDLPAGLAGCVVGHALARTRTGDESIRLAIRLAELEGAHP